MKNSPPFSALSFELEKLRQLFGNGNVVLLSTTQAYKAASEKALFNNSKNHPRFDAFINWLNLSEDNKTWYAMNKGFINLVDDGIELLGDVFCLEDEQAEDSQWVCNRKGHSYFTHKGALKHARLQGKKLPYDWVKYIQFLPGDYTNRAKFLIDVLGLNMTGYHPAGPHGFHCQDEYGFYWSANRCGDRAHRMVFNQELLHPYGRGDRASHFKIRCIKSI